MPSRGQTGTADAAGVTEIVPVQSPPTFAYDDTKARQILTDDALRLLKALRHEGEGIWFQTFADAPDSAYTLESKTSKGGRPYVAKRWTLTGVPADNGKRVRRQGIAERWGAITLNQLAMRPYELENLARCGVFFTVNVLAPTAERRKADQVTRVAAVFLDLDGAPLPAHFPLRPTAIVESSVHRYHVYWAVDGVPLAEFTAIQKHLAGLYGGDPKVCDLPRVMRLPGYWHGKQEPGELVKLTTLTPEALYTYADLLAAWPSLTEALTAAAAEQQRRAQEIERRRAEAAQLQAQIASSNPTDRAGVLAKYGAAALRGLEADLLGAVEGERNDTLNRVTFRAGQLVAAGVADEAEVCVSLGEIAERLGLEATEIATTLHSALAAGKQDPADLSGVGQHAGKKRSGAQVAAHRVSATEPEEAQASAKQIPDPEGEGGTYSDQQVKDLLGLAYPTVAADTDTAHAYRLRDVAGENLGYVAELGGYVAWNGRQWLSGGKDGPGQVEARRHAQRLGAAMRPEVDHLLSLFSALTTEAARTSMQHGHDSSEAKRLRAKADAMEKAYFSHGRAAKATESDAKQKAILSSARTLYVKDIRDFEPQPWLVGFPNGTWDRGEFRPSQREDHLLTLAAVVYQPDADQGDWLTVLDRITGGNTDLQRTLQDVAGYALSGASSLRLLPWCYGASGTGKSTFSELLATVLGDMAGTIDPKLFAADAARERLGAAIWGKRVALCAEAGNQRLDAEALKTLSGGDRLSVRMLYAEGFTARASHVLVMVANDAPRVEAYDDALKDRVLALPFDHPLKAGGPLLGGRRLEELRQDPSSALVRGFTAWAVQGLENVYRAGDVHRAEVCRAATQAFWDEVDPLHDFWSEQDLSELAIGIEASDLRRRYEAWCQDIGTKALGAKNFGKACRSVGLEQVKSGVMRWKLTNRGRFPGGELGRMGKIEGISSKPQNSSYTREGERDFSEKASDSTHSAQLLAAAGWEGEPV